METQQSEGPARRMVAGISRRATLRRLGLGGAAAGAAFAIGRQFTSGQSAFTTAATEAAARRAISAVNQALASGDMSVLDAAFAPDYVNHTPRSSLLTGQPYPADLAGLKTALTELRAIVPDAVILIDDVVASGDTAAVRATLRGTIDTSVVRLPEGADPRLRIGGAVFARFVGGQVVESWGYDEAAGLYAVAPVAPAQPAEEPVARRPRGDTQRERLRPGLVAGSRHVGDRAGRHGIAHDRRRAPRAAAHRDRGGERHALHPPRRGLSHPRSHRLFVDGRRPDRDRAVGVHAGPGAAAGNRRVEPDV